MIYFVGAGAGDPELLTIKGKRVIDNADVIVYAGSLVNKEIFSDVKSDTKIYNSASMTLEEVMDILVNAEEKGLKAVRVHTGDPSLYGAVREQFDILEKHNIQYEVIPGVSSFLAAAAALKKEYTLPDVSQTVILTRMEGRTPVPEPESIESLASHNATMVIFLSVKMTDELVKRLLVSYPPDTPAAVVYKASWKDEKIIRGTLENISEKVKNAGITKTALVIVGNFLGDEYELSKLYDRNFTHEFRQGAE